MYVLCVCPHVYAALLDIPVYKSRVQSLHVLFSLYMEFKNSQVTHKGILEIDMGCRYCYVTKNFILLEGTVCRLIEIQKVLSWDLSSMD